MSNIKNIFIIAGESSGDQHAANYVNEHKKLNPDTQIYSYWAARTKKNRFRYNL